jgi:hypothetical protein
MMYFIVVMTMSVHTISDSEPRTASGAGCSPTAPSDLERIERACADIAVNDAKGGQTQRREAVPRMVRGSLVRFYGHLNLCSPPPRCRVQRSFCRLSQYPDGFPSRPKLVSISGAPHLYFGGSLFAVVFFRHLPEIDSGADSALMLHRGLQLVASLFALFCATLELERLGRALESIKQD